MTLLTEIELYYPDLPNGLNGLTILHIGDLHSSGWGRSENILQQILRIPAPNRTEVCDLVVFSGDMCHQMRVGNPFVEKNSEDRPLPTGLSRHGFVMKPKWRESLAVTDRLLKDFSCAMGICLVQGNHDCPEFMDGLQSRPVHVLDNQTIQMNTPGGARMNIMGCCGYGRAGTDIPDTVAGAEPGLFSLVITHFPEFSEPLAAFGADLILAGHTHGGQVCLPGRKALKTHSRTGSEFVSGLTRLGNGYQFTTRGLGTSMLPIRICCPPEVARFTLRQGDYRATTTRESKVG